MTQTPTQEEEASPEPLPSTDIFAGGLIWTPEDREETPIGYELAQKLGEKITAVIEEI